eukprot:6210689-Pleurochrysis_carterae.AAC.2
MDPQIHGVDAITLLHGYKLSAPEPQVATACAPPCLAISHGLQRRFYNQLLRPGPHSGSGFEGCSTHIQTLKEHPRPFQVLPYKVQPRSPYDHICMQSYSVCCAALRVVQRTFSGRGLVLPVNDKMSCRRGEVEGGRARREVHALLVPLVDPTTRGPYIRRVCSSAHTDGEPRTFLYSHDVALNLSARPNDVGLSREACAQT